VIKSLTLRKLSLAPIAALALVAGLLGAAPANAAVVPSTDFTVTSLADGETVESRTVEFTGTGTPEAAVGVTSLDGLQLYGEPVVVDASGAWSITVEFAANAETAQSLLVTQVIDLTTAPISIPVKFNLPAAPELPEATIVLTDPGSLEILTSRTVTFAGSAPAGTEISIANVDGSATATTVADELNGFSVDLVFSDLAPLAQSVTVSGLLDGTALTPVSVVLVLPPLPLTAPVFTSPAAGSTAVSGGTVVISGTGDAGATIALIYAPTADLASGTDIAMLDSAAIIGEAGDIIVGADGTWSTTITLAPNSYSFYAAQSMLVPEEGNVATSGRSERLDFTLVAQAITPAITPVSASGEHELAATGIDNTGLAGGISGLLLALGVAAMVANRRRQMNAEL
jgi:hypothetical protein